MNAFAWLRNSRSLLAFGHDVVAAALAWALAYWLRLNLDLDDPLMRDMLRALPWVVPAQAAVFLAFGLYRGIWRYASVADLKRIVLAGIAAAVAAPLVLYLARLPVVVPRSVVFLDPLLLVLIMGGSRFAYRMWKEHRLYGIAQLTARPALVLGAGDAAANLLRELSRSQEWRVVGLLDDNAGRHGRLINGVRVLGALDTLPAAAKELQVEDAIIAMPSASHTERRRALELCSAAGVKAMTVPSYDEIISGRVTVSQIRGVELDDLLGRDPVRLDDAGLHRLLEGRTVMVTGAGGSIGSELCRQIARFAPARLVLFELSEFALYQIEQEFADRHPRIRLVPAIGDVKNRDRVRQVMDEHRPQVLFHAAAYKHVPLMEDVNAWEAVLNNVHGTLVTAEAAVQCGVEKFVFVSTDKAVNPVNVMGASKRLAEMVCQALQPDAGTRFVMVRFGNVLGSTGSVIPRFREQIARGGPVTVTHPEIRRYFMSIPEACQLVLQAGLMGSGGEIFVLDMGEPVKIVDLARDLIRLSGLTEEDVPITFTGLRPGEKLYEEPIADDENTLPTPHPKLRVAKARAAEARWLAQLRPWLASVPYPADSAVRAELARQLPEYRPGGDQVAPSSSRAAGAGA